MDYLGIGCLAYIVILAILMHTPLFKKLHPLFVLQLTGCGLFAILILLIYGAFGLATGIGIAWMHFVSDYPAKTTHALLLAYMAIAGCLSGYAIAIKRAICKEIQNGKAN